MTSTLASQPGTRPVATHEHGWSTESTHRTSEGVVRYVRCDACGARRVDVDPAVATPPVATSAVVARTAHEPVG